MTDYALIHERKEARKCGTHGIGYTTSTSISSRDATQDILEYMHIHVLQETAASVEHTQSSPSGRWPNLCMHSRECSASEYVHVIHAFPGVCISVCMHSRMHVHAENTISALPRLHLVHPERHQRPTNGSPQRCPLQGLHH